MKPWRLALALVGLALLVAAAALGARELLDPPIEPAKGGGR